MRTPRWSSFSVALTILVIGTVAFNAGRRMERSPAPSTRDITATAQFQSAPGTFVRVRGDSSATGLAESRDARWRQCTELARSPATPAGEQAMARVIEELASTDPWRAISEASSENNFRRRTAFLRAALTGWGKIDPNAAATWLESQALIDRSDALGALLQGAVTHPERAIALVDSLSRKTPPRAADYGAKLISAFTEAGQFERAAAFALTAPAPAQTREDWILPAYSRWAEFQPKAAAASARQLPDPAAQAAALNAIVIGWAPSDPKGLIEFAQKNLTGSRQNTVVARAIGFWADADLGAAADWIGQNDSGAATDPGIAEIAESPQLVPTPAIAASWAENITSPQLRLQTLGSILEQWASTDASGAAGYLGASKTLAPDERISLLERVRQKE